MCPHALSSTEGRRFMALDTLKPMIRVSRPRPHSRGSWSVLVSLSHRGPRWAYQFPAFYAPRYQPERCPGPPTSFLTLTCCCTRVSWLFWNPLLPPVPINRAQGKSPFTQCARTSSKNPFHFKSSEMRDTK